MDCNMESIIDSGKFVWQPTTKLSHGKLRPRHFAFTKSMFFVENLIDHLKNAQGIDFKRQQISL